MAAKLNHDRLWLGPWPAAGGRRNVKLWFAAGSTLIVGAAYMLLLGLRFQVEANLLITLLWIAWGPYCIVNSVHAPRPFSRGARRGTAPPTPRIGHGASEP